MTLDAEAIVIGGGAVGLASALALAERGHEVMVLEKATGCGLETSARNSEVVHAGLYYPTGSWKARLCLAGNRMLSAFCRRHGVPFANRQKLIVATNALEQAALGQLLATARASGASGLAMLDAAEVRAREPALRCHGALLSRRTSVFDSGAFVAALEGRLGAAGATIIRRCKVRSIARDRHGTFVLSVISQGSATKIRCRFLVIAAGHDASRLALNLLPGQPHLVPQVYAAKGHYYLLSGRAPFQHLVYPMPSHGSLGIHYTLSVAGEAKFGPDIEWVADPNYAFDDPDGARLRSFETSIRRYWPDLPDGALRPGYTGLRPKLSRAGEPARDFAIHGPETHGVGNLVALYGIESPGLTASLAIGEIVARLLGDHPVSRRATAPA